MLSSCYNKYRRDLLQLSFDELRKNKGQKEENYAGEKGKINHAACLDYGTFNIM